MKISVFACLSFCGILIIKKKKINEPIQNLLGFRVFWSFTFCFAVFIIFCLFLLSTHTKKDFLPIASLSQCSFLATVHQTLQFSQCLVKEKY